MPQNPVLVLQDQLFTDTKLDMSTLQENIFQARNDDLDDSDNSGKPNVLESGEADVPPSLPPPLTSHPSSLSQHSPGNQELQYLIHYLQVTRSDEERRQDEEARAELQAYRLQMENQQQLDDQCFMQLLSPPPPQVQQTVTPEQEASSANQLLPIPPVATMSSCPHALITAPFMDKPPIPIPPQLQSDVTIQLFRQWCRRFYSVLIGLHNLPQPTSSHTYMCFAGRNTLWDIAQPKAAPALIVGTRVIDTKRPSAQPVTLNVPLATNRATSSGATRRARRGSSGRAPKPVNVTLSYGSKLKIADAACTAADITVIGTWTPWESPVCTANVYFGDVVPTDTQTYFLHHFRNVFVSKTLKQDSAQPWLIDIKIQIVKCERLLARRPPRPSPPSASLPRLSTRYVPADFVLGLWSPDEVPA
nr:uncharacterized protein LOC113818731 [Penaeus vannamei]